MKNPQQVIIIDDDELNNFIIRQHIKMLSPLVAVFDFTNAEKGFEFLLHSHFPGKTPVLLDINMPGMGGWEFIENFGGLGSALRKRYSIYLVSASTDEQDEKKGSQYPDIKKYLIKPVTISRLKKIIGL
jgi:two-component system, chemotaxis family, chemotaxis protein CheY